MKRAFAVKALAVGAALAAIGLMPSGWGAAATAVITVITIAFLAYVVVHPRSQFLIPVVSRLPTHDPLVALTFDDGPDPYSHRRSSTSSLRTALVRRSSCSAIARIATRS